MCKKTSRTEFRFSGFKKNFTCKNLTQNIKYSNKNIIYGLLILGLVFGLSVSASACDHYCDSCSNCSAEITAASAGQTICLNQSINSSITCIDNPSFSNKIFDCQGYAIDGNDTGNTYGIYLNNKDNAIIKNCVVTDFNFGIYLINYSDNNHIINNTANSNRIGIILSHYSNNNTIINNNASSNNGVGAAGIQLSIHSEKNIVTNNTANDNYHGVILATSPNNTLIGNNANNNNHHGVILATSPNNTLIGNNANNNNYGIGFDEDSDFNNLSNNQVKDNTNDGVGFDSVSNNNSLNSNYICGNGLDVSDSDSNIGDENTCNTTYNWNDSGTTGCTWSCPVGVQTSTNTGTAYFSTNKGMIANLTAVNESSLNSTGKPNLTFIHGFFEFNITGLLLGENVTVKIELLGNLPANSQYWKYGPNCNNNNITEWYQIPMGSNDGDNIITINLTDGGLGDDNCTPDGMIIDQGGPGSITIDSMLCDGGKQDAFNPGDHVCTFGNTTGTCDIYKCSHRDNYTGYNLTTNCANIPTITGVFDNVSVCTGGDENCTMNSAYDLVLDCDRDGYYNESTDAIDDSNTVQGGMDGGFYITPEPMAAVIFIAGLSFLYGIARIRKK